MVRQGNLKYFILRVKIENRVEGIDTLHLSGI